MRYVVAVAELENFTRAAKKCLVVQSALSHQIARLEKELGARLFDRTSRQVRLTAAGEAFLPAARQALDAAERARAEVTAAAGKSAGVLGSGRSRRSPRSTSRPHCGSSISATRRSVST